MHTSDTKNSFVELRGQGWSYARIAKKLNVSKPTLLSWAKSMSGEINRVRNFYIESLLEKHKANFEHRIEILGIQQSRIIKALNDCNLGEVSPEKLIELMLKLSSALKAEQVPQESMANSAPQLVQQSMWHFSE
jgi:intein-encoded DNA endonuclease-like protein